MRRWWFKLFALMLGLVLCDTLQAQEVFYVYRTDGSVQVFELASVDSMFCSQTDLSGRRQTEFVTQEIWTPDSVYRIPMAEVDSVVFDVNRLEVSGDYRNLDGYTYQVEEADTDQGQFTVVFSGTVPELGRGDVVVFETDTATYLRRVTDAAAAGGYVSLTTEEAYLSDLFPSGSFVLSTEPSPVAMSRSASGDLIYYPVEIGYYDESGRFRRVRRSPATRTEFERRVFSEVIDYSGKTLHQTAYTDLYLETCRFDYNLDLVMSFNFNSLQEGWEQYQKGNLALYKAVLRGNVETDFMLRFDAEYERSEDLKEVLLKRNVHKPVYVKFVVGEVPVLLTLNTHLLADGEYSCEGDFSAYAGYASSTTAELGFSWTQSSGLKPYATFQNDFTWHKPTIEGEAHLDEKLSVFPRLNFSLYGLSGPSFDIKPYLRQTLDLSFWDELGSNPRDYYGSEYNLYTGFDGAVSVNFLPLIGNNIWAGPVKWNISNAPLYTSPYDLSFKESSSETVMCDQPVEVTFSVRDYDCLFRRPVTPIFPLSVKFETNCGRVEHDFANVDVATGDVIMTWIPSTAPEGETPYLQATLYNSEGKVLAEDRWETTIPSVQTLETGSVTEESAVLSGSVSGISGSSSDCRYGFFYGTSSVPSVGGLEIQVGSNRDGEYAYSLSNLKDNTTYYYCAYLSVDGQYTYGDVRSFTTEKKKDEITPGQMVDLGLSVKWAGWNVGASRPEEYGGYYAWGELHEKSNYDWDTYQYYDQENNECIFIGNNISGTQYDVARVQWGGSWRMPTRAECQELVDKCTWTWTTYNGVNGQKVTGPNGNSIFLPAAGYRVDTSVVSQGSHGFYWSGTLIEGDGYYACYLTFYDGNVGWGRNDRYSGHSVRPVSE